MPDKQHDERKNYLRFAAMIITAMVVMYALTYFNTYQWSHVRWSETRFFMTIIMGGSMALIMLAYMLGMYRDTRANVAIVVIGIVMMVLGTYLVRSQTTVEGPSYMRAMIPHHSIAILTSENSEIEDVRVCRLAKEIIEAQRREISEMEWLISDIAENGPATTAEEAERRAVPTFVGQSIRSCPEEPTS